MKTTCHPRDNVFQHRRNTGDITETSTGKGIEKNRLGVVEREGWPPSFGFGYDALSRRTSLTRPSGVNTSYGYDAVSHLLSVLHQTGATMLDARATPTTRPVQPMTRRERQGVGMRRKGRNTKREAIRRKEDRARGVELARGLGIKGEKGLVKFCLDKQQKASARGVACLALGFLGYKPGGPARPTTDPAWDAAD